MNKSKRNSILVLSVFLGLALFQPVTADQAAEKEAFKAANNWLALVDGGSYAKSWERAADYFKAAVQEEQWVASLTAIRKPLGRAIYRTLKYKKYTTTLPGAPDGEYVVLQFATSFERKKSAMETVTPMRDKDGKWRVSGYYIK
ncbi:MAG: DUF4019 domain-containing protein [Candidatus Methylomirabilales bacterium]